MENCKLGTSINNRADFFDVHEKFVNNQKLSDFLFTCSDGGQVFAHKSLIAMHCEAFEAMLEAGLSETATGAAKVADIDSETMTELMRYLYCRRVKNMKQVQERLVMAANKYGIEQLKNLCVSSLMESLTVENVINIFDIAELLGEEHLKKNFISFIKWYVVEESLLAKR